MLSFRRNEQGDTIVEVLIAIAIVSLILTAAYVITSKNTAAIQENQERIQAQHLVESQIEALRAQGGLNTTNTSGECFVILGATVVEHAATDSGNPCTKFTQAGSGATYTVDISGPAGLNHASPSEYTILVTWASLSDRTSAPDSNVTMFYRLN